MKNEVTLQQKWIRIHIKSYIFSKLENVVDLSFRHVEFCGRGSCELSSQKQAKSKIKAKLNVKYVAVKS